MFDKIENIFDERSRYLTRVMLSIYWLSLLFWYQFNHPLLYVLFVPLSVIFSFYTFVGRFTLPLCLGMGLVIHRFLTMDGIPYPFLIFFLLGHRHSADEVFGTHVLARLFEDKMIKRIFILITILGLGFCYGHFLTSLLYNPFDFQHAIAFPFIFLLVPAKLWNKLFKKWLSKKGLCTIYYDGKCQFCHDGVKLLKALFLMDSVQLLRGQSDPSINQIMDRENSWVVKDGKGEITTKHEAILAICKDAPVLQFLVPFLSLSMVMDFLGRFYHWLSSNRGIGSYWLKLIIKLDFHKRPKCQKNSQ